MAVFPVRFLRERLGCGCVSSFRHTALSELSAYATLVLARLASIVAATALYGIVAASGQSHPVQRLGPDGSRFAGAFVDWGTVGREHSLQKWEKWLQRRPTSVLGGDFYGRPTDWDEL